MTTIRDIEDFRALDPFFRIIERGLEDLVDGRPYNNRYISVIALTDRKISRWRDYLDPLRIITALTPSTD
jgi:ketosteroid isomerase-like protein